MGDTRWKRIMGVTFKEDAWILKKILRESRPASKTSVLETWLRDVSRIGVQARHAAALCFIPSSNWTTPQHCRVQPQCPLTKHHQAQICTAKTSITKSDPRAPEHCLRAPLPQIKITSRKLILIQRNSKAKTEE